MVNLNGGHDRGQECPSGSSFTLSGASCKLCVVTNSSAADSHDIGRCPSLSSGEKKEVVRSVLEEVWSWTEEDRFDDVKDRSVHSIIAPHEERRLGANRSNKHAGSYNVGPIISY